MRWLCVCVCVCVCVLVSLKSKGILPRNPQETRMLNSKTLALKPETLSSQTLNPRNPKLEACKARKEPSPNSRRASLSRHKTPIHETFLSKMFGLSRV